MAELSPTQIVKQWKVSKTTIYKHINDGTITYKTTEDGHKRIELSEVLRVFGEPKVLDEQQPDDEKELEFLKQQVARLEKDLSEAREEKRKDREFFQTMLESQSTQITEALNGIKQLMVEHKPEPPPIVSPAEEPPEPKQEQVKESEEPKKKRGLFKRIVEAVIED